MGNQGTTIYSLNIIIINNSETLQRSCAEASQNNKNRKDTFSELLLLRNIEENKTLYQ